MSGMKTTSLTAFASQLRAWRQQMGWTQVEAAEKLGYSASLVSGIETMDKTPTTDFAQHCDTIFQTPGTFATMRDLVAREVWPSYFAPVIELEATAIRIHEWEMRVVPGLLQTEDYARAVISAGRPQDTSAAVDRAVGARLERQATREELLAQLASLRQARCHHSGTATRQPSTTTVAAPDTNGGRLVSCARRGEVRPSSPRH